MRHVFPENLLMAWKKQNENEAFTLSARDLICKKKCVLVTQSKLIAFFEKGRGRWKDFYQEFSEAQGITFLSRVGFDEKGDRALVYEGTMSGNLKGRGYFVLLDTNEGVWTIEKEQMIWMS